jgi:hypothetical protein
MKIRECVMGRPEKFTALREDLEKKAKLAYSTGKKDFPMTFAAIERFGVPLPKSAYNYIAWWHGNNGKRAWSSARFRPADVDLQKQQVTFRYIGDVSEEVRVAAYAAKRKDLQQRLEKTEQELATGTGFLRRLKVNMVEQLKKELAALGDPPGLAEESKAFKGREENEPATASSRIRHPAYGALKGYIRLVAGTDLTGPADPEWGERVWGGKDDKKK